MLAFRSTDLRRRAALGLAIAATALGGSASGGAATQDLDLKLSVRLNSRYLDGIALSTARGGELRVSWRDGGPSLALGNLGLDRPARPEPVERSAAPSLSAGCLTLAAFEYASSNRVGGSFFGFAQEPSSAAAELVSSSDGGRVLSFEFEQAGSGYAGVGMHLHDPAPVDGSLYFLDSRPFEVLSFLVRGRSGDEAVTVRLSDAESDRRDSAVDLSPLAELVGAGRLTTRWQRAEIRLDRLPATLDRSRLDKLVLVAREPGVGALEIDDLRLCAAGADENRPPPATDPDRRALWVWNTSELLASSTAAEDFLAFLGTERIDTVYLQVPGELSGAGAESDPQRDAAELRSLLARLGRVGIAALALDGAPSWALPEKLPLVEAAIRNIARYNRAVAPAERFVGVHYDVEPYLLDEYSGDGRWEVLRGYLAMLGSARRLTLEAGLTLEAAIPFWLDGLVIPPAEDAPEPVLLRPVSEQVIDLVDRAVVMDYRTQGEGSNGTLAMAEGELLYASEVGGEVVLGLETTSLPDEEFMRFYGAALPGLPAEPGDALWVVGIQRGDQATLHLVSGARLTELRAELEQEAEVQRASETILHWEVKVRIPVPGSRGTFHDLGPAALERVMAETRRGADRYAAFGGIAIHHYGSYRRMVQAGDPPDESIR